MDYKEKYNAALERARELSKSVTGANYEYIFPELKESEDERIRKELIQLISCMHDADHRKKDWMAWLEKQGEQKQAIDDAYLQGICDAKHEIEEQDEQNQISKTDEQSKNPCSGCTNTKGCITCLNGDQRQTSTPKILYSDEVIEWIVANICDFEYYVKLFKKDFGL